METIGTLNINRLAKVLSDILSQRYGQKITITIERREKDDTRTDSTGDMAGVSASA